MKVMRRGVAWIDAKNPPGATGGFFRGRAKGAGAVQREKISRAVIGVTRVMLSRPASSCNVSIPPSMPRSKVGRYAGAFELAITRPSSRRIQTLELDGAPVIQMVFATDDGLPVALCVMEGRAGPADDAAVLRQGMASFAFDSTHHHWLLIGTQDNALIDSAARELRDRLNLQS